MMDNQTYSKPDIRTIVREFLHGVIPIDDSKQRRDVSRQINEMNWRLAPFVSLMVVIVAIILFFWR